MSLSLYTACCFSSLSGKDAWKTSRPRRTHIVCLDQRWYLRVAKTLRCVSRQNRINRYKDAESPENIVLLAI
jgi:hypothetical protein